MYNTHRTGSGISGGGLTTAIGYHVQTKRNSSRPSYYYIVYLYTLLYYIIDCVRHTTGEPGDLLLYSCSRFRVPFIAYTRTHAHKYMSECYKCACVSVYEFFFSYSLSIPFIPFLRPFDRIRFARARVLRTRSVSVHSATGTTAPPTHRDIRQLLLKSRRRSIINSAARTVRVNSRTTLLLLY